MPDTQAARVDELAESYLALHRRGAAPSIDEYARAHPDVQDELHEVIPALLMVDSMRTERTERTAQPTKRLAPAPVPERIDDYRVVRRLGEGGMAVAYEAETKAGERVAIKVIRADLAEDESFAQRFVREAAVGLKLQGPYVVRTLDVGVWEDPTAGRVVPFLVLPYVEGTSLRERIQGDGRLPEAAVRAVGADVCRGLRAVHDRGLVHRDVKPTNVMLTPTGTVLMDLGIARPCGEAAGLTKTGEFVGTVAYAAPEQFQDDASLLGPWTDFYALGLTLYEAATGCDVFVARIVEEGTGRDAHLGDELRAALRMLRAKDPADRPQTADVAIAMLGGAG